MEPLPSTFYDRDALEVAADLIGCVCVVGPVSVRLTDVEAYRFPNDTANHARMGRTCRNRPMWGPPGRAYVYLCYGLHNLLNLVTGPEGHAAAVLIRGAEPIGGLDVMRARRRGIDGPDLLTGPGRVGAALGLDTRHSGLPLDDVIRVYPRERTPALLHGPRVGIAYASIEDQNAPWRIAAAGTRWVGRPRGLAPRDLTPAT